MDGPEIKTKVHEQNLQYFQIHSTTSNFETFTARGQASPLTDNWGYECEKTQDSSFEIQLVIVRVSTRFKAQETQTYIHTYAQEQNQVAKSSRTKQPSFTAPTQPLPWLEKRM